MIIFKPLNQEMNNTQIDLHSKEAEEKPYSSWNGCCMLIVSILLFPAIIGYLCRVYLLSSLTKPWW